jgi:uncharacterized radical SAM protein YgiQ
MLVGLNREAVSRSNTLEYISQLVSRHVSGRLKVAPEHSSERVLKLMRKPSFKLYIEFKKHFDQINKSLQLKQQILPYLISSHPGSTGEDMAELAAELKRTGYFPEQVQDFTPTPMTLSSVMYYTGTDPYSGKKVHIPKTPAQKLEQQKILMWYKKENESFVKSTLHKLNRRDLIGKLY